MNFVTRFIVALILVCCLCELSHAKKGELTYTNSLSLLCYWMGVRKTFTDLLRRNFIDLHWFCERRFSCQPDHNKGWSYIILSIHRLENRVARQSGYFKRQINCTKPWIERNILEKTTATWSTIKMWTTDITKYLRGQLKTKGAKIKLC